MIHSVADACVLAATRPAAGTLRASREVDAAMQVLLSTGSLAWFAPERQLALARAAGVDAVELLLTPRSLRRDPRYLLESAARHGIEVRSVHSVLRLRSPSPEQAAADIVESARFAVALDHATLLVVHPPVGTRLSSSAATVWFRAIATASEIVERSRVRLAIENPGRELRHQPLTAFDDLEYLLRVAEEWDLALTLDTAHAASAGRDILAAAEEAFPRLANVHVSDAVSRDYVFSLLNGLVRDHRLPGRGELPLAAFFDLLRRRRYDGLVTLELSPLAFGVPLPRRVVERARQAVAFCRGTAQRHATGVSHGRPKRDRG